MISVYQKIVFLLFRLIIFSKISVTMGTKLDAKIPLHVPDLKEIAQCLQAALSDNFEFVNVSVADCPDLTADPYQLAAKGLGGSPRIVDVGGPGFLMPVLRKDKIYNLTEVCQTADLPGAFALGPGAGPYRSLGINSEMVHNSHLSSNILKSYAIFMKPTTVKPYTVKRLDNANATEFSLMANLLLTEGKPGKVIKVNAKKRTGKENFVTRMRLALAEKYGTNPVGMGGAFLIKSGKANMHIMPDFPTSEFTSEQSILEWLNYFDMEAPLVCASVFVSHDPGLDLRVEHTHCYSCDEINGGHYHYDTSPNEIEYEGYFTVAEHLYRVDKP